MSRILRSHLRTSRFYFWLLCGTFCALTLGATAGLVHRTGEIAARVGDFCYTTLGALSIENISSTGLVFLAVLLAAALGFALWSLVSDWVRVRRFVRGLEPARLGDDRFARIADEIGIGAIARQVEDDSIVAFAYGVRRVHICISKRVLTSLNDDEVKSILLHEAYHAYRRDPLRLWLARATSRGMFFLPVASKLMRRYEAASELAADQFAASMQGHRRHLSSALIHLLEDSTSRPMVAAPGATTAADLRVLQLLQADDPVALPPLGRAAMAISLLGVAAIVASVIALSHAPSEWLSYNAILRLLCSI